MLPKRVWSGGRYREVVIESLDGIFEASGRFENDDLRVTLSPGWTVDVSPYTGRISIDPNRNRDEYAKHETLFHEMIHGAHRRVCQRPHTEGALSMSEELVEKLGVALFADLVASGLYVIEETSQLELLLWE